MKTFLFLCGPNGIGKTTIAKEILHRLPRSAYVDSDACRMMNPFVLNDDTVPTVARNISSMLLSYLDCPLVDTVLFTYGFHGRRREVFSLVEKALSHARFHFVPFLLWCEETENLRRMQKDGRSERRIQTALQDSRKAFSQVSYPVIDVTALSAAKAAEEVLFRARLQTKAGPSE